MDRMYSILTVKAVEEDERVIRGVATTPAPDRVGDVIEPLGVTFNNPMPLLHQHDHDRPVGTVKFDKPTKDGITFEARLPKITEPGPLKDRVDTAWGEVKAGLVRAVSIGFRALEYAFIEGTGGIRFTETEVMELSLVSVPANAGAQITAIKSIDRPVLEAKGIAPKAEDRPKEYAAKPAATGIGKAAATPGVSGKPMKPVSLRPKEAKTMKTLSEQIAAFEAKRAASQARMEELQNAAVERGESKSAEEKEEFQTLKAEVAEIDSELADLRDLERTKAAGARPVSGQKSADGSASREGLAPVKVKAAKAAPGVEFARLARVKALANIDHESPLAIAKALYGEDSPVVGVLTKGNVVAGSSVSGTWAADLVGAETAVYADFAEYLQPMTIIGKFGSGGIPSLMRIPFRTPLILETGVPTGYWVGEGKPKPVSAGAYDRTTLDELKVAAISVVTEELLRKSSPSADALLRNSLARAVISTIDVTFIDPAVPASPGVSPASITNGVSAIASSGNDADAIREDLRALWGTFIAANNPPTSAVYIMSSMTALALSLMVNPLGQAEFAGITMAGGTFQGIPVITSEYLSAVSAGGFVVLANASDIYFGDEGGVSVDMSREASLQMLDNPTNDTVTPTATSMVSMFQTNSVAFRAERILNWKKRRASAVAVLDEVNWGMPAASV
jgi:HK97 family phage major capsid protein/HK97 family phage prohead protease